MSFQKIHLKLHKNEFVPASQLFPIEEEPGNYDRFIELLTRVGTLSEWNRRKEFHDPTSIKKLKELFELSSSYLWVFKGKKGDVGFCQIANVENLTRLFNHTAGVSEIYKVGLFPEHLGKGIGKGYVSSVITEVLKTRHTVYLNTRDTNIVNSVPFYKRLGFEVFKTETFPDDLVNKME